jgi:hypothetical protein
MGRPVKRDVAGTLVFGDYTTTQVGIRVEAYFGGSLRDDCFIIKQKGSRSYFVQDKSDGAKAQCKLVTGTPAANGELRIIGWIGGDPGVAGSGRAIAKLQKRTAIDFNSVRYTWSLTNDSSADFIALTAL